MGVVMVVGIVVSNSILVVEFIQRLRADAKPLRDAITLGFSLRLRPVLLASLATVTGLLAMAAKLGTGIEAYAPLVQAVTRLATLLGLRQQPSRPLAEQPLAPDLSANVSDYLQQALQYRPDLLSLWEQQEAAVRFAKAERALRYPTISATGSGGLSPVHEPPIGDSYVAAGILLNRPIFTGGLYSASQRDRTAGRGGCRCSTRSGEQCD